MKFIRVYTGDDGESHFEEFSPEMPAFQQGDIQTSPPESATAVLFTHLSAGYSMDWHPAPRRQYVFHLTARNEFGMGDGSTVILEPGDVLLVEDTTGRGHTSRALIDGVIAYVPLVG